MRGTRISTAWGQIGELQLCRGRAAIRSQLVPFSRGLDVRLYHQRAKPFDDEWIVGGAERLRPFRAAGMAARSNNTRAAAKSPSLSKVLPRFSSTTIAAPRGPVGCRLHKTQ